MYTQCPNCHAVFTVTSQQLREADGMVRCGQCEAVFNGREYVTFRKSGASDAQSPRDMQTKAPPSPGALLGEPSGLSVRDKVRDDVSTLPSIRSDEPSPQGPDFSLSPERERGAGTPQFPGLLVPDIEHRVEPTAARLLWSTGALVLLVLLAAQVIWFNRANLVNHPNAGPLIRRACSYIECGLPLRSDPGRITLVSREVYTHPDQPGALMISAVVRNDASFAQAPPGLLLSFSDLQGTVQAARLFEPAEYLADPALAERLLPPGDSASIRLELVDPGNQARNFEIGFR